MTRKAKQQTRENTNCKSSRRETTEKGAARRRRSGKRRGAGLGYDLLHMSSGVPGTCRSGAVRANTCPFPKRASLNTGYPTPFRRSLLLRTCELTSSARTMKEPLSFPIREKNFKLFDQNSPQGAKRLPISRSSNDLDWRTVILVLLWQSGTVNFIGILSSIYKGHKDLTFGSCFQYVSN